MTITSTCTNSLYMGRAVWGGGGGGGFYCCGEVINPGTSHIQCCCHMVISSHGQYCFHTLQLLLVKLHTMLLSCSDVLLVLSKHNTAVM